MPYNPDYFVEISEIITKIQTKQIAETGEALDKFKNHVAQTKNIGRYNPISWDYSYLKRIYEFGQLFAQIDPTFFLSVLDSEISKSTFDQREILHFIRSEILVNFDKRQKQEKYLTDLSREYITNAEFLHTLGHIKLDAKSYIEAIEFYTQAVRMHPSDLFINSKFNCEVLYAEYLIETEKYDNAEKLVNDLLENIKYRNEYVYKTWLMLLSGRIKDYKLNEKKISSKQKELHDIFTTELQAERKKFIELLGLFTAIIAFIFTTVSVAKTFDYEQAIKFTACLGLVLINFAMSISIIFQDKKIPLFKDVRLWVAVIITTFLYLILAR